IQLGEAYSAAVVDAVLQSPAWPRTVLVFTYDEHGGHYDPVAPPRAVPPGAVVPLRAARAGLRDLAILPAGPRVARGLRPHVDPPADRDQVQPGCPHPPGRQRRQPARLPGPARRPRPPRAAPAVPAGPAGG